jgi:hypothetical protein
VNFQVRKKKFTAEEQTEKRMSDKEIRWILSIKNELIK